MKSIILTCAIPVVRLNYMEKWIQSKKHNYTTPNIGSYKIPHLQP